MTDSSELGLLLPSPTLRQLRQATSWSWHAAAEHGRKRQRLEASGDFSGTVWNHGLLGTGPAAGSTVRIVHHFRGLTQWVEERREAVVGCVHAPRPPPPVAQLSQPTPARKGSSSTPVPTHHPLDPKYFFPWSAGTPNDYAQWSRHLRRLVKALQELETSMNRLISAERETPVESVPPPATAAEKTCITCLEEVQQLWLVLLRRWPLFVMDSGYLGWWLQQGTTAIITALEHYLVGGSKGGGAVEEEVHLLLRTLRIGAKDLFRLLCNVLSQSLLSPHDTTANSGSSGEVFTSDKWRVNYATLREALVALRTVSSLMMDHIPAVLLGDGPAAGATTATTGVGADRSDAGVAFHGTEENENDADAQQRNEVIGFYALCCLGGSIPCSELERMVQRHRATGTVSSGRPTTTDSTDKSLVWKDEEVLAETNGRVGVPRVPARSQPFSGDMDTALLYIFSVILQLANVLVPTFDGLSPSIMRRELTRLLWRVELLEPLLVRKALVRSSGSSAAGRSSSHVLGAGGFLSAEVYVEAVSKIRALCLVATTP